MKTLSITLVLVSLFSIGFSNDAYQKAMSQSIEKLFQATTIPEYVEIANQFDRISQMEKTEWLPLYYASYAYIMISFQEQDNTKKDTYLDQAQKYLDQAMAIEPNESELYMLQGFLYPSRINIDPMNRGMVYMGKMNESLDKALELNPDNPRVYFLRATMTFHTPEAYGGGAAKALPFFKTADEKFRIFKPKNDLSPNWGKEITEAELKKILEQVKE
jgi:tetratricopeptide (TPR) repeat protein